MRRALRKLLQSEFAVRTMAWCAARMIATYLRTLRVHVHWEDPDRYPPLRDEGCIYSLWHENVLLMAYMGIFHNIKILVSQSRDGRYITNVVENMGYGSIRGSSSRGAVRAVREMVNLESAVLLAFTPDGPRGPRREFQPGAVYVASRAGLPILPVGFAYARAWRASSWDRMVFPKPFSRAACYGGKPIYVPPKADSQQLADYVRRANEAMDYANACAERLLEPGREDVPAQRRGPGQYRPPRAGPEDRPVRSTSYVGFRPAIDTIAW